MSIQLFFLFFTHIIFIQIIHSSQYDNDDHHHYYEPSKSLQSPTILKQIEDECNKCDRKKCSPIIQCNVGIVRDKCGCCDICALEEAQLCNIPNDFINGILKQGITWYGICGTDLECRKRTDIDSKIIESQSICYCVKSGKVCGSDGITYSKCKMNATIISSNGTVIPISEGPCQTGNYKDVTVSVRGGTEETHTISYLQITSFTLEYEGEYICMADNIVGIKAQGTSLVRNAASSIYSSSSS
ncbi:insulin-like growth factor binding protein-related [Schistosoma mansoni]|uniref:insulin-like growth factor binding protein-related n=1 Tax=Schistosoma mansoni TaxID=6183 RepID=UPI00022DC160|nr:insulin-like growth factor binding protein-related [Schistosoma mansoni]|eukprot:XP_018649710.1 insulin-like growth factor binding protein-related [Schistosoma mansoni]